MFNLTPLPYGYADLEPTISELTMRTHHDKHHAKYVEATNALMASPETDPLEAVVRAAARRGAAKLFDNAAQAWNHGFFWQGMSPRKTAPSGSLLAAINSDFGGLANLRERFVSQGLNHFGSGWIWLVLDGNSLGVLATHDAGCVIIGDERPLLVCDVWEHAYYLDHKSDRGAYLRAWWDNLINWPFVAAQYEGARGLGHPWCYADGERRAV